MISVIGIHVMNPSWLHRLIFIDVGWDDRLTVAQLNFSVTSHATCCHGLGDAGTFRPGYGAYGAPCQTRAQGTFLERLRQVWGGRRHLAAKAVHHTDLGRGGSTGAPVIDQILFQLTSALASVGRVKTSSHGVSRGFNALALGAVAADFAVKYAHTGRADFLVGLIVFVALTVRTLLILGFGKIEGSTFLRRVACAVAFLVCAVASVGGQFWLGGPIRPITLLPLAGVGFGCLGEASNDMIVRRRCVLVMGCIMAAFGLATEAWGLVFKNIVSDVGATVYSMNKYRDPLPSAIAVWYQRRGSAA